MKKLTLLTTAVAAAARFACGGGGGGDSNLPQLGAATGAALAANCSDLATSISFPNTTISSATPVAAGTIVVGGNPAPAHCLVQGSMYQRTSPVDGKNYASGFEMRLPNNWNGRFYYQGNGGPDGSYGVNGTNATGPVTGGGATTSAQ